MGIRNDSVTRWRQIADTEITAAGGYEEVNPAAEALGTLNKLWGGADSKEVKQNQQMLRRLRATQGRMLGPQDVAAISSKTATDKIVREGLAEMEGGNPADRPGAIRERGPMLEQEQIRENRIALHRARQGAGQADQPTDALAATRRDSMEALLRELVALQRENNKMQAKPEPSRPLTANTPKPKDRMGG
jgi:hypothetical protein